MMLRFAAYRFQLRPKGEQERKMRQFAGSARYVWNRALAIQKEEREKTGRKQTGYGALCRELTRWRNDPETEWLSEGPVHTTQQALRDLEGAWSRHFDSLKRLKCREIKPEEVVQPPQFKKKQKSRDSFLYPDPKQFEIEPGNNRLFLPKLGWIGYRNSRKIEGQPSNVTVSREGMKWFVSIQTEREVEDPVHPSSSIVSIDLGVVRFATVSNGEVIEPCNAVKKKAARRKRYQRRMARCEKFSQNWKTSQTCPACGHVSPCNRKTQAVFMCVECGDTANADDVAAQNILRAGHARIACEVNGAGMPSAAGTHRGEALCASRQESPAFRPGRMSKIVFERFDPIGLGETT